MRYRKALYIFMLVFLAMQGVFASEEEVLPVVEIRPDRVVIYPERMELSGEETLFDMLQLYPDFITNAYDNWLEKYEMRIDNGPYGGDVRFLLNEMKASRIKMIQISDNPGVAKGTVGFYGIIDVFLQPLEKGAHGTIGAELSHDLTTSPFAEFRYGSESTDILANASYNYYHSQPYDTHEEFSNFHMKNQLSEKDQLVTYITQIYTQTHDVMQDPVLLVDFPRSDNHIFSGQVRNYHYFTPDMFLMSAIVYQYWRFPTVSTTYPDDSFRDSLSNEKLHVFAAVEEFNATFFDRLNLMAGLEADYVTDDENYFYPLNLNNDDFTSSEFNTDLYVELDYTFRKWRFTAGDRVRYYRYRVTTQTLPSDVIHLEHRCHNLMHASVIYTPHREHQIQLAYAQKYQAPPYTQLYFNTMPINEVKLAYGFARPNLTASLNAYYYNYKYYDQTFDAFKIDASAYYRYKYFSISGGVQCKMQQGGSPTPAKTVSAAFRLMPVFDIPFGMQVKARTIFYTPSCSLRQYSLHPFDDSFYMFEDRYISRPVYGELQFTKFWPMVDVYAIWHDIFNGNYGIATVGCRVKL